MISSLVLLKECEFLFVVNCLYVVANGYLRLGGSYGLMDKMKSMS